jgi:hypothetical protein
MFTVDPSITDLKVKEKSMLKVLFSMNTHQVATPEMNLEEARSYVIFCGEGGGKTSAFIGLHMLDTNRRLFYPHSSNPFPEEEMNSVDEEARGFAEGMGAMLDEIDLTKMSPEEKNHWIDDQAIFNINKQIEAKPVEQTAVPATGSLEQPTATVNRPQEATSPPVPGATVSAEQPAPAAQPQETVAPAIPAATSSVAQAAPADEPQEVAVPAAPVNTIPAPPAPEPPKPSMQPRPPERPASAPAKKTQQVSTKRPEDVIQRAIRAGVVKGPKQQLSNESRSTNGIVSRDKEALARLLSSF